MGNDSKALQVARTHVPVQVQSFDMFAWSDGSDMIRTCEFLADSQFVPKAFQGKPADIACAIVYAREVGLSPLQGLQNIAVINGRPTLWGDGLMGVIQAHPTYAGKTEKIEGQGDERTATCIMRRIIAATGAIEEAIGTFSVADAKKAGLWGKAGPWTQYPDRMMKMRARGFVGHDLFSDVLKGLSMQEEMEGSSPLVTVTPDQMRAAQESAPSQSRSESVSSRRVPLVPKEEEKKPETTPDTPPLLLERLKAAKIADLEALAGEAISGGCAKQWLLRMRDLSGNARATKEMRETIAGLAFDHRDAVIGALGDDALPLLAAVGVPVPGDDPQQRLA